MSASGIVRYSSISAIGAFTDVNTFTGDYLHIDPARCSGGGDPELRTSVEDAPGRGGVLPFPPLEGLWVITLGGPIVINSASDESGYMTAVDALYADLAAALDAMMTAPDDLVHSNGTLSVWKYSKLDPQPSGLSKVVTFSLVVDY